MSSISLGQRRLSRRGVLTSIAGLSGLGLVGGCAKDSSSGSGSDADVLNVGQTSNSIAFFPLHIAEQNGYFSDAGVKLGKRPRLGTGAKLAAAIKSGSIDIGAGVITDAYNLHKVDSDSQVVAGLVTDYYVDVVVGKGFSGPSSGASVNDKITALTGKKIGITGPGSGTEALLIYLFKQIGKDAKTDATLVNLGSDATGAVGALKAGRVDALSFFQPIGQIAEANKVGSIYISPVRGDIASMKGQFHGCVFGTSDAISKKQKQVDGFNKAIDKALQSIRDDAAGTKKLLKSYLKSSTDPVIEALFKLLAGEMSQSHLITEKSYTKAREFHIKSGLFSDPPSFTDFIPESSRA